MGFCLLYGISFAQQTLPAPTKTEADLYTQAEAKFTLRQYAGAIELYQKIVAGNPYADRAWYNLARALYGEKKYAEAIPAYEKAFALGAGRPPDVLYDIACCQALLNKKTEAMTTLEKAMAKGFPDLEHIRTDEDLKILRDDPKFRELAAMVDTKKMSRDEGWRYDLKLLAREIKRVHYDPFRATSREEFDRSVKKLHADIPRLSDTQIGVGFMKLLRMVGDGHTSLHGPQAFPAAPVQFYLFEEGLFIIAAAPKVADLAGAEVLKVGGHPAGKALQELTTVISRDNEEWCKLIGPNLMRQPQVLNGLGLIPAQDKIPLTIRDAKGVAREVVLDAEPGGPTPEWAVARPNTPEATPLTMKKRQTPYWYEYLPDTKTVFFQYNMVRNDSSEPLTTFCDRLFKFIGENEVERLVIDMRWNGGGNNFLNRPLVHGLIKCDKINQRGKLFVIVGRNTFSAAMCGAMEIQRHTNAIFAGEPTGSRPNFVGETNPLMLPYSGFRVSISNLYWQNSVAMDYRNAIVPEIYAPPTFAAYKAGRDTALEAILHPRTE